MKAKHGFGAIVLLLLGISTVPLMAENQSTGDKDAAAVRTTVTNYIEAYYSADAPRMESTLHPHYLKHVISTSDGRTRMTEKTGLQMVQDVRRMTPVAAAERKEQVTVLDVSGDIASAKLETPHWVDYLTLEKLNGEWKIVSVVLREHF